VSALIACLFATIGFGGYNSIAFMDREPMTVGARALIRVYPDGRYECGRGSDASWQRAIDRAVRDLADVPVAAQLVAEAHRVCSAVPVA
jgi:hypothetical protein